MLRNVDDLYGFTLRITGANAGRVSDFLFTDRDLAVRYLVVDTGTWLTGRQILVGTEAVEPITLPMWEERKLFANLTQAQIENAPDIDTHSPISREQETELRSHYGWLPYWVGYPMGAPLGTGGITRYPAPPVAAQPPELEHAREHPESELAVEEEQPVLRSTKEVAGYSAQASDGKIGRVASFLVDDQNWAIQYLIVDTTEWQRGGEVIIPVGALESIRWSSSDVFFRATREKIKNAPGYDRARWSDLENERRVQQYYGYIPDRDI